MKYLRPVLVLALFVSAAGTAVSQKIDPESLRSSPKLLQAFREVVAKPSLCTVRVQSDGKDTALGAIVEADGWIITKASEVSGKITVKTKDGQVHDAKLTGAHPEYDIAMLKINAKNLPTVEWRDSKEAKVGKWVATPGEGAEPVAIGVISVGKRKLAPFDQPPKNPLSTNTGYLGVDLEPGGAEGAKVSRIEPKGPAERAGIKVNDVIYEIAGVKVLDDESLRNNIQRLKAGDTVQLKIIRGEEELELKATLGKIDPKLLGNPQERMGSLLSARRGGFPTILQHDTVLKPTDCGGPLVDLDGKTVGINIARAGRTETYAIPAEDVQTLIAPLKQGKLPPKDVSKIDPSKDPNVILRVASGLDKKDLPSTLRKGSFQKIHTVKLSAGVTYEITMESGDIDSYLFLQDAKGTNLAEDDDGGGGLDAHIQFRAPADGDYRIIATTFQPNQLGSYTLTVRRQQTEKDKK